MPDSDPYSLLRQTAIECRQRAYAPYSRFHVGAALLCADGTIVEGVNVENASYGLAICAERSAVVSALSQGYQDFQAIAIAAHPLAPPCGACRQFLAEFNPAMKVILLDPEQPNRTTEVALSDLLPMAFRFNPEN